jgi:hypothetical protein
MLTPTKKEIKEYMDLYNNDEIGKDNPITMEEAEYNLLNSDEYHYKNKAIEALNRIDELASQVVIDNNNGEAEKLQKDYEVLFNFIKSN